MRKAKVILALLMIVVLTMQCVLTASADDDKIRSFVTRCYQVILGRNPDEKGLNDWSGKLSSGQTTGTGIITGFFTSNEFATKSYSNDELIELLYKAVLNRSSDAAGKQLWLNQLNEGKTFKQVIAGFCSSNEFKKLCADYGIQPGSASAGSTSGGSQPQVDETKIRAFVTRCYQIILGREPEAKGLNDWTSLLASGKKTAAEIIDGFYSSQEFRNKNHNYEDMVEILYNTMLDRASDQNGKEMWVGLMYSGYSYKHIINGFCNSTEFKNLCKKYGITPGSVNEPAAPASATGKKPANITKVKAFVTRCYNVILGREPDAGGLDYWTTKLANGTLAASEIIDGFFNSIEFKGKGYSSSEKVEILYKAMLGRASDKAGKEHWMGILEAGNPIGVIINGFCGSTEFKKICNDYGILPGSVKNAQMYTGWQTINSQKYYFNKNGQKATGITRIEGSLYFFSETGVMQTGWQTVDGKRYYLGTDGKMATDWIKLGSTWYYFKGNGEFEKQGPLIGKNTGVDLTGQKDINNEFIAWLSISGTNVSHPVVWSNNVDWYLNHNFTGQTSKDGTLLSLGKCGWRSLSKNIVIYGHHVEGSGDRMFKALLKYKDASYYKSHPVIALDSMYMDGRYRIFAVFDMLEGTIDPSKTSFGSDDEFMEFVNFAKTHSKYNTGVSVGKNDTIITLVTCDRYYKPGVGRLIVMAVREK